MDIIKEKAKPSFFSIKLLMMGICSIAVLLWSIRPLFVSGAKISVNDSIVGVCIFLSFGFPLFVTAILQAAKHRRRMQEESFLWLLTILAERGMPFEPSVRRFADSCGKGWPYWMSFLVISSPLLVSASLAAQDNQMVPAAIAFLCGLGGIGFGITGAVAGFWNYRGKIEGVAHYLERGFELDRALEAVPHLVQPGERLLVVMGAAANQLGSALRQALELRKRVRGVREAIAGSCIYLFTLILTIHIILFFNIYYIAPKFFKIMADFGVNQDEQSWHERFYDLGANLILPGILVTLILTVAVFVLVFLKRLPPIFDRLTHRIDAALMLRAASMGVESDMTLKKIFMHLIRYHHRGWMRVRLDQIYDELDQGLSFSEALKRSRLLRPSEVAMLDAATRTGNLAWTMRHAADSCERLWVYRMRWLVQTVFPITIMMVGVFVLIVSVWFFWPLIAMIERLVVNV